jgi:hypothetical protein
VSTGWPVPPFGYMPLARSASTGPATSQ